MLTLAHDELAIPITHLINESIKCGIVPDIFKISCVTPIHKSGDTTDPSNYRPISVLPALNKVLERVVYDQLLNFLDKHHIINSYQFGFRKCHSTEQAILETVDTIRKSIDNNEYTCGIFLDFKKAFDTVDHNILLSKLYKYGIRGLGHNWFTDYLTNRQQYVKVGNIKSCPMEIKCGVPQGSTLGPLLFLLYINDLPNTSQLLNFRLFADDTNIFYSNKDPSVIENVINTELIHVLDYCAVNKLTINFSKTHYIIFKSVRKKEPVINIPNMQQKDHIKYLGVYLDKYLNWEHQIKVVHSKVSKNIGIIRKLRYYVDLKTLTDIYYSLIYPYLSYGILAWGSTYKTNLARISTVQNKCVRTIFYANRYEHAAPLYNILGILTFDNMLKLNTALLGYKIVNNNNQVPIVFRNILKMVNEQHSYNTRYSARGNIVRPHIRTNYGKFTFQFSVSKIWEKIPIDIKNLVSIFQFKKAFKMHLIQSQE